jgi:hypothetical protein
MGKGKTNRTKGHNAERYYAKVFRELGFTYCKTSRLSSRMLDNCKVDLAFLPFNIQIKGGKHKGLKPSKVLSQMKKLIEENYPPYEEIRRRICIVIHRKAIYSKYNDEDSVYITKNTLCNLLLRVPTLRYTETIIDKNFSNEFREIVRLDFKEFKGKVVSIYN